MPSVKDNTANLRKYASLNRHLKVVNNTIRSKQLNSPNILIENMENLLFMRI